MQLRDSLRARATACAPACARPADGRALVSTQVTCNPLRMTAHDAVTCSALHAREPHALNCSLLPSPLCPPLVGDCVCTGERPQPTPPTLPPPQVVIVMRHGHRQDEEDEHWAGTAPRPWDPPLSLRGRQGAQEAAAALAAMQDKLQVRVCACVRV